MSKWFYFCLFVIFCMAVSTIGVVMILRWYQREVAKLKQQPAAKDDTQTKNS